MESAVVHAKLMNVVSAVV
jgi:hypothetical protein